MTGEFILSYLAGELVMRVSVLAAVVAASLWAVPAEAEVVFLGGGVGKLNFLVTKGYYDPDGPVAGSPRINLAGLTGKMRFEARVYSGLSRSSPPYDPIDPFYYVTGFFDVFDTAGALLYRFRSAYNNDNPVPGVSGKVAYFGVDGEEGAVGGAIYLSDRPQSAFFLNYENAGSSGSGAHRQFYGDPRVPSPEASFEFKVVSGSTFAIVPEPATWSMLIGGVGMVGGALRRRKANVSVRFA